MANKLNNLVAFLTVAVLQVRGHGNLGSPLPRSDYNWNNTFVYNDCGFWFLRYDLLFERNRLAALEGNPVNYYAGSECGACGDFYNGSRFREYGYPNTSYFPRNVYRQNTVITVSVVFQNPHKGYAQLRIGENITLESNENINVTLANFEQNLLNIVSVWDKYNPRLTAFDPTTPTEFYVMTFDRPPDDNNPNSTQALYVTLTVALPPNLVSDHATMQFNYITGQPWYCPNVTRTDCYQQNFRSCSDIRIVEQDAFTFLFNNMTGQCLSNSGASYSLTFSNCLTAGMPTKDAPTALSVLGIQPWNEYATRNGSIVFETSGYCLDVSGTFTWSGAQVGQWPCKNEWGDNQAWWTEDLGDGFVRLRNKNSLLYLSADAKGNIMQLNYDAASSAQAWKFLDPTTLLEVAAGK